MNDHKASGPAKPLGVPRKSAKPPVRSALALACSSLLLASAGPAMAYGILSQCGPSWDTQNVEEYDGTSGVSRAFVKLHQRPVGMHVKRGLEWCSGTLITRDLFLTAGHCLISTVDENNEKIRFDFQIDAVTGKVRGGHEYEVSQVLERIDSATYDYAIARLSHAPGDRYGYARIADRDPGGAELLSLIGHPDGVPKVVSNGSESGASSLGDNWFRHTADTLGGSSGSGVLDQDGLLVGVHTNGGCDTSGGNSAMRMSAILAKSRVLKSLGQDSIWRFHFGYSDPYGDFHGAFASEHQDISGKYQPFSGDFDGNGSDDIFWYGPGRSAPDHIWWGNHRGDFDREEKSVSGIYTPFAGDFDGDGDDDIFWYAPGSGRDVIWWSDQGAFSSQTLSSTVIIGPSPVISTATGTTISSGMHGASKSTIYGGRTAARSRAKRSVSTGCTHPSPATSTATGTTTSSGMAWTSTSAHPASGGRRKGCSPANRRKSRTIYPLRGLTRRSAVISTPTAWSTSSGTHRADTHSASLSTGSGGPKGGRSPSRPSVSAVITGPLPAISTATATARSSGMDIDRADGGAGTRRSLFPDDQYG
jgi:V8-like Glu-specific endopeptidase